MERRVDPGGPLRGTLEVPGDKSQTHRVLMLGALADGPCRAVAPLRSGDIAALRRAMAACGVKVADDGDAWIIEPPAALVEPADVLDLGNSGTSLRLLTGLLAGQPDRLFVLTGDGSLRKRPMARVVEPLRRMGAVVTGRESGRLAPMVIEGRVLQRVHHDLSIASAQVKSSMLLAGLGCGVSLTQPAASRDHTERMLAAMGARVTTEGARVELEPVGRLTAFDWTVAGDASSAAFWLVAASIVPGSEIVLRGVGLNPHRTGVIDVLRAMGADLEVEVTSEAPEP
ncbi:MAG: 3-phosphoshikimate 1-carboxyvinyltransferase, partial [Myxococcota bacterium]